MGLGIWLLCSWKHTLRPSSRVRRAEKSAPKTPSQVAPEPGKTTQQDLSPAGLDSGRGEEQPASFYSNSVIKEAASPPLTLPPPTSDARTMMAFVLEPHRLQGRSTLPPVQPRSQSRLVMEQGSDQRIQGKGRHTSSATAHSCPDSLQGF